MKMLKCKGGNSFESLIVSPSGKCHYLLLTLPHFPLFKDACLETNWNLRELLQREDKTVFENLESFLSTDELLSAVTKIINKESPCFNRSPQFYVMVFEELIKIGPSAVIKPDFTSVDFKQKDAADREHKSTVELPSDYPNSPIKIVFHELPLNSSSSLGVTANFSTVRTLSQFYQQFCDLVNLLQPFWEMMDNFDANCCVIEPKKPLYSDCYRRIQLKDSCTALLTFNPFNPGQRPSIEFRGPDDHVTALRNTLESHLMENHWDPEVDAHLNLLYVLDLDNFVSQEAQDEFALVQLGECGICFDERLDGQPPTQRCDNALCQSQYHHACLLKYLSSALNSVRVANVVMGRCPTCKKMISCPQQ